jgi:hypothetical protein
MFVTKKYGMVAYVVGGGGGGVYIGAWAWKRLQATCEKSIIRIDKMFEFLRCFSCRWIIYL